MSIIAYIVIGFAFLTGAILIYGGCQIMSEALDRLTREVAETRGAAESAAALIAGLAQQIRYNIDDSDQLNALADSLDESQSEIAAAVNANSDGTNAAPLGNDALDTNNDTPESGNQNGIGSEFETGEPADGAPVSDESNDQAGDVDQSSDQAEESQS